MATISANTKPTNGGIVRFQRAPPNLNDIAGSTLRWLGCHESPGIDRKTLIAFLELMRGQNAMGNRYATPAGMVSASAPCSAFFASAKREQRRWFKHLNGDLYKASIVKRAMAERHPILRQLEHTGVMIVEGKHIFPHRWNYRGLVG